jgi:hypothetical protein
MKKMTRGIAAIVATGALVAAGVTLSATAANAEQIAGSMTLYAKGSNVGVGGTINTSKIITSGSTTSDPMYWAITINGICPTGFRGGANTAVFQDGEFKAGIAQTTTVSEDGLFGSNGLKGTDTGVAMSELNTSGNKNNLVNTKSLDAALAEFNVTMHTGAFELRYYCFVDPSDPNFDTDKFFTLPLLYDAAAHTWSTPAAPVQKVNSTVSLTAASNADKTASLTATVKKADGTVATNATGTVAFSEGATSLGTGTITNGVATLTTAALAEGSHSFTATFAGDANYNASPVSGPASVFIAGAKSGATTITVAIPSGIGGITLSGVPSAVNLGTAALSGGRLVASNHSDFTNLTVTDTRQMDAPDWTLTGSVTDFKTADNSKTLLGKYLGWKPWILSGPGVAGPGVTAGNGNGLTDLSTLASGKVTDGQPTTVVKADLDLSAPANTPGGTYNATLTVTLS